MSRKKIAHILPDKTKQKTGVKQLCAINPANLQSCVFFLFFFEKKRRYIRDKGIRPALSKPKPLLRCQP